MTKELTTKLEKITALLDEAHSLLDGVIGERIEYFEAKSEKWQESDKGQEYSDFTTELEGVVDSLDEALGNMPE